MQIDTNYLPCDAADDSEGIMIAEALYAMGDLIAARNAGVAPSAGVVSAARRALENLDGVE